MKFKLVLSIDLKKNKIIPNKTITTFVIFDWNGGDTWVYFFVKSHNLIARHKNEHGFNKLRKLKRWKHLPLSSVVLFSHRYEGLGCCFDRMLMTKLCYNRDNQWPLYFDDYECLKFLKKNFHFNYFLFKEISQIT